MANVRKHAQPEQGTGLTRKHITRCRLGVDEFGQICRGRGVPHTYTSHAEVCSGELRADILERDAACTVRVSGVSAYIGHTLAPSSDEDGQSAMHRTSMTPTDADNRASLEKRFAKKAPPKQHRTVGRWRRRVVASRRFKAPSQVDPHMVRGDIAPSVPLGDGPLSGVAVLWF